MFEQISYGSSIIGRCIAHWRQAANRSAPIVLAVLFVIQFNVNQPMRKPCRKRQPKGNNYGWCGLGRYFAGATGLYRVRASLLQPRFWVNVAKSSYFQNCLSACPVAIKWSIKPPAQMSLAALTVPNMTAKAQMPRWCCASLSMIGGYTARH